MRKFAFLYLLCFLFFFEKTSAQINKTNIIGLWQIHSPIVGSGLGANYRFFANGTFIYGVSGYDNLSRIRAAGGTYTLNGNILKLSITYRMEIVGGELIQGGAGFQQEELVLEGGKIVKVLQKSTNPIEIAIEVCKSKENSMCMQLQNNTYYKVSKDPKLD